jgi:hypothetical protein
MTAPHGIPRNDFAGQLWQSDNRDEDQYRADREFHEAQLTGPRHIPTADEQAREAEYRAIEDAHNHWMGQHSDYFCLGHVAYQAKYGTYLPPRGD